MCALEEEASPTAEQLPRQRQQSSRRAIRRHPPRALRVVDGRVLDVRRCRHLHDDPALACLSFEVFDRSLRSREGGIEKLPPPTGQRLFHFRRAAETLRAERPARPGFDVPTKLSELDRAERTLEIVDRRRPAWSRRRLVLDPHTTAHTLFVVAHLDREVREVERQLRDRGKRRRRRSRSGIHGQHAECLGDLSRDVDQGSTVSVDAEHLGPSEPSKEAMRDAAREHRQEPKVSARLGREVLRGERPLDLLAHPLRRHRGRREDDHEGSRALHLLLERGHELVPGPQLENIEEAGDTTSLQRRAQAFDLGRLLTAVRQEDDAAVDVRARSSIVGHACPHTCSTRSIRSTVKTSISGRNYKAFVKDVRELRFDSWMIHTAVRVLLSANTDLSGRPLRHIVNSCRSW